MMSLTRSRGHVCGEFHVYVVVLNTSSIHDRGGSDCLCTLTRTVLLDAGRKRENHNDRA